MISNPVDVEEFKEVLIEVKREYADYLHYGKILIDVTKDANHIRFHVYVNGEWDSFETTPYDLIKRIHELYRKRFNRTTIRTPNCD